MYCRLGSYTRVLVLTLFGNMVFFSLLLAVPKVQNAPQVTGLHVKCSIKLVMKHTAQYAYTINHM